MGFILSKFRRQKPSTKDELEKMDKELRELQRFQFDTELTQKNIIGKLVIFSSVIYLLCAAVYYLFGPTANDWTDRLLYLVPFIVFPFIMWFIKRLLNWYFSRKIRKNKVKYDHLKKEKGKILDDVMEKETFKVAKEILEKYAPGQLMPKGLAEKMNMAMTPSMSPLALGQSPLSYRQLQGGTPQGLNAANFQDGLRRRQIMTGRMSTPIRPGGPQQTPMMLMGPRPPMRQITAGPGSSPPGYSGQGSPQPQRMMIRAPSPPSNPVYQQRKMGWFDKLVEFVVGDGPSSRFALICRYCGTHNGLSTTEEFPYIGYRCVFCHQYNPPRQVRPSAPKLPTGNVLIEEQIDKSHDKSESAGETRSPIVSLAESSSDETQVGGGSDVEELPSSLLNESSKDSKVLEEVESNSNQNQNRNEKADESNNEINENDTPDLLGELEDYDLDDLEESLNSPSNENENENQVQDNDSGSNNLIETNDKDK